MGLKLYLRVSFMGTGRQYETPSLEIKDFSSHCTEITMSFMFMSGPLAMPSSHFPQRGAEASWVEAVHTVGLHHS